MLKDIENKIIYLVHTFSQALKGHLIMGLVSSIVISQVVLLRYHIFYRQHCSLQTMTEDSIHTQ